MNFDRNNDWETSGEDNLSQENVNCIEDMNRIYNFLVKEYSNSDTGNKDELKKLYEKFVSFSKEIKVFQSKQNSLSKDDTELLKKTLEHLDKYLIFEISTFLDLENNSNQNSKQEKEKSEEVLKENNKDESEKIKDRLKTLTLEQLIYVYRAVNLSIFLPETKSQDREYYINSKFVGDSMPPYYVNEKIDEALRKDFSIVEQPPKETIKSIEEISEMKNLVSIKGNIILQIKKPIEIKELFGKHFVGVYVSNETHTDFENEIKFINTSSISYINTPGFDYDNYFEENRKKLKGQNQTENKDVDTEDSTELNQENKEAIENAIRDIGESYENLIDNIFPDRLDSIDNYVACVNYFDDLYKKFQDFKMDNPDYYQGDDSEYFLSLEQEINKFNEDYILEAKEDISSEMECLRDYNFHGLMEYANRGIREKVGEFKEKIDIIMNSKDEKSFDTNFDLIKEVSLFLHCDDVYNTLKEEWRDGKDGVDLSEYDDEKYNELKEKYDSLIIFIRENLGEEFVAQFDYRTMFNVTKEEDGSTGTRRTLNNYHDYLTLRNQMSDEQKELCDIDGWGASEDYEGWKSPCIFYSDEFKDKFNTLSEEKQQEWRFLSRSALGCELKDLYIEAIKNGELKEEINEINLNKENENENPIDSIEEPESDFETEKITTLEAFNNELNNFRINFKNKDITNIKSLEELQKRAFYLLDYIADKLAEKKLPKNEKKKFNKYWEEISSCKETLFNDLEKANSNPNPSTYSASDSYRENLDRARAKKAGINEDLLQFTSIEKLQEMMNANPELKNQFDDFLKIILEKSDKFKKEDLEKIIKKLSDSTGLSINDVREIYENQQFIIESQAKSEVLKGSWKKVLIKGAVYAAVGVGGTMGLGVLGAGALALGGLYVAIATGRIIDNIRTDEKTKKKQAKKIEEIKQNHSMDDLLAKNLLASVAFKKRLQIQGIDLGNAKPEDIEKNIELYIDETYPNKNKEEKEDLIKAMSTLYQIDQNNKKLEEKISKKDFFQKLSENKIFQEITTVHGILKSSQTSAEKTLTTVIVSGLGYAARSIPVLREILGAYAGYRVGGAIGNWFFKEKGVEISKNDLSKILNKKEDLLDKDKEKFALAKVKISEKGFKEKNPEAYLELKDLIDKYEELEVLRLGKNVGNNEKALNLINSLNNDFESEIKKRKTTSTWKQITRIGFKVGGAVVGGILGHYMADMQRQSSIIKDINKAGKLNINDLNNIMNSSDYAKNHNIIEALIRNNELPEKAIHDIISNPDFMKDHGIVASLIGNNKLSYEELNNVMSNSDFAKNHEVVTSLIKSDYNLTGHVQQILENDPKIKQDQDLLKLLQNSTSDSDEKKTILSEIESLVKNPKHNLFSGLFKKVGIINDIKENQKNSSGKNELPEASKPGSHETVPDTTKIKIDNTNVSGKASTAGASAVSVAETVTGNNAPSNSEHLHQFLGTIKSDADKKLINDVLEHAKHVEHVDKGEYVSGVLHKAMTADSKITVINPDGTKIENFDANLVHPGDTVIESQDGSIYVLKTSDVTVHEGDSLAGIYKRLAEEKLEGHLNSDDVSTTPDSNEHLSEIQQIQRQIADLNQSKTNNQIDTDSYDRQYHDLQDKMSNLKNGNGSTATEEVHHVENQGDAGTGVTSVTDQDVRIETTPEIIKKGDSGEFEAQVKPIGTKIYNVDKTDNTTREAISNATDQTVQGVNHPTATEEVVHVANQNTGTGTTEAVSNVTDQVSLGGGGSNEHLSEIGKLQRQIADLNQSKTNGGNISDIDKQIHDLQDKITHLKSGGSTEQEIKPIQDDGGELETPKTPNVLNQEDGGGSDVDKHLKDIPNKNDVTSTSTVTEKATDILNQSEEKKEVILKGLKIYEDDTSKDKIVEEISTVHNKGEVIDMGEKSEIANQKVTELIFKKFDEHGDKVWDVQSHDKTLGEVTSSITESQDKKIVNLEDIKPIQSAPDVIPSSQYSADSFYSHKDAIAFDNIQKISSKLDNLKPGNVLNNINIKLEGGKVIQDLKFLVENDGRYIFDSNKTGTEHIVFEPKFKGEDLQEIRVVKPNESDINVLKESNR